MIMDRPKRPAPRWRSRPCSRWTEQGPRSSRHWQQKASRRRASPRFILRACDRKEKPSRRIRRKFRSSASIGVQASAGSAIPAPTYTRRVLSSSVASHPGADPPSQIPANSAPRLPPKRKRPAPPPAPRNPFARADPWAQLEERDWRHVVSDVLQVVDFFAKNDFLKGVERRVGEIEEEGGIEDLGEVPHGALGGGKTAGIEEVSLAEKNVDDGPAQEPVDEGAAAEEDLVLGDDDEDSLDQDDTPLEDAEANEQADAEFLEPPSDDEEGADESTEAGDALMAYLDEDGDVEVEESAEGEGSAEVTVEETGETIAV